MENNSIFFQVTVIDNQDPMMLGRIRAKLLIDNYNDIVKSITDPPWNEEKDAWTARDPFIFNPFHIMRRNVDTIMCKSVKHRGHHIKRIIDAAKR